MKKTVALIGVDGTGKSTIINRLKELFGDEAITMYMGSVRFEDPKIEELAKKPCLSFIESVKYLFLVNKCFWGRYRGAVKTNKIVLFDRYVHERYLNATGKRKLINLVLYKYLFPRTSCIIYLYCSAETSLKRKDDIPDAEVFHAMKKRFDSCFLNSNDCLCLDTDTKSVDEITNESYNYIIAKTHGKL